MDWNARQKQGRRWFENEKRNLDHGGITWNKACDETSVGDVLMAAFKQPTEVDEMRFKRTVLKNNHAAWTIYNRFIQERKVAAEAQGQRQDAKRLDDWWEYVAPIPGNRDKHAKKERRRQEHEAKEAKEDTEGGRVPLRESMEAASNIQADDFLNRVHDEIMDKPAVDLDHGPEPVFKGFDSASDEDGEMEET